MIMPTKPRIAPTERSMLRVTMTSTMPVDITAMEAVWTDRFQRLRGVRKTPPERTSKPIQMIAERRQHADQARVDLELDRSAAARRRSAGRRWWRVRSVVVVMRRELSSAAASGAASRDRCEAELPGPHDRASSGRVPDTPVPGVRAPRRAPE